MILWHTRSTKYQNSGTNIHLWAHIHTDSLRGSKPAKTILLQLLSIPYTSILPSIYRFNQH